jgi:hypothetical protein
MESVHSIAITYRDDANNTFVTLGGAAWLTQEEWESAWDNIPEAGDDSACCIADKKVDNWDIVDDRIVSRATVETLLSKPIEQLLEEASVQHQADCIVALIEDARLCRATPDMQAKEARASRYSE